MIRIALTAAAISLCSGACVAAAATPMPAREQPQTTIYFGEAITDPYRWMEKTDASFVAWLHAQDDVTRAELQALPGYNKLLKDTTAAVESQVRVGQPQRVDDLIYYRKLGPGEAQGSLYVRSLVGGAERRLVDPVALKGSTTAINDYAPSPDNRYLAYCLADGGSEEATLYIEDLQTGKILPEAIDRARFASPSWSADSAWLFYTRLKAGGSGTERFSDEAIYRHKPGEDPAKDVVVFTAAGVGSEVGRNSIVSLFTPPDSEFSLAAVNSGVSPESEWYVTPTQELKGNPHWRRIASLYDKIDLSPVVHGRLAWFVTFREAPRRKVVRIDLDHPDLAAAAVVVPERAGVIKSIANGRDGIYVVSALGDAYSIERFGYGGGVAAYPTPTIGTLYGLTADPRQDGAVVGLDSWIQPGALFETAGSELHDLRLAPAYPFDLSALTVDTVVATAKDGVKIPVTVVHRRDIKRDGSAALIADAYGAYGESSDAYFDPALIPFLLRGGVYAEAHVRGGGEFGETWHLAGKEQTKPNTWRDFIASIEALEGAGYTSPAKVAGMGVSAGGIMIGRTVTERPDLLTAAVMWAPMVNTLRFETTEGGPLNIPEFGTVTTRKGYTALRMMDTYSHVVDGTKYPAVLITGGVNDHRVPVWMAAEMAARLQKASASGKPVRLRIDFQGGHHMMGAAKSDRISQQVDTEAFVLRATGDPDFQTPAVH